MVYFPGCPGAKKTEFLTSVLDALSTDMVHAVTDPASAGRYLRVLVVLSSPHARPCRQITWKSLQVEKPERCASQDGRAGSKPHPGRKGGALVLQPARQKLQRGHWEKGDQTLQTLSAEEIQAKEVCEEVCGVLRHQQRQGHLSAGADGLPGRDQRRRWPEHPRMMSKCIYSHLTGCGIIMWSWISNKKKTNKAKTTISVIWRLNRIWDLVMKHPLTCSFCITSGNFNKAREIMFSHLK